MVTCTWYVLTWTSPYGGLQTRWGYLHVPQCNKTLMTSKFKQHFAEGEEYDITHRERYERALDDPSLLLGYDAASSFVIAQMQSVSAQLKRMEVHLA
ncbi:hypothetical protein V7S43_008523 [Phytophthora oleae]|uniref:Uncharacterized protein n=1 Tax=Phytophthora oleae TaxID=2107226 RepID=A0ABD3FH57_9STRA